MEPTYADGLLTVRQLAAALNVPRSSIYERAASLPHYRVGRQYRFVLTEVLDHLRRAAA